MRNLILFFLIILFFSCKDQKDQMLISEDDMVNILIDIHSVDGVLNTIDFPYTDTILRAENYYNNILIKHHITRQEFDSALSQYVQNKIIYLRVYDKVIAQIRTKQSQLSQSKN